MVADVAVLGSANVDVVVRVPAIPGPGETVLATGRERHAGGKGLNQAVAAARAGAGTVFLGALGRDRAGNLLLQTMREAGVDTTVLRRADEPSGRAYVVVADTGENTIVVDAGANATLTSLTPPERAVIEAASVLVAQLEVPLQAVAQAAATARRAGTTVVVNAAPARPLSDQMLSLVDVLVVNETEAAALAGVADPEQAAAALARHAARVVVTLGARGAALIGPGPGLTRVAGLAAVAVDTTAAGDTFVGVMAAALAAGDAVPAALRRAVAAGALAVETHGAVPSIPTRAAVDDRLRGGSV